MSIRTIILARLDLNINISYRPIHHQAMHILPAIILKITQNGFI